MADDDRQRIDKWLWFARVTKTRTAAQLLLTSGRVRLNRVKVGSSSHPVRVGDVLTIALDGGVRVLRVAAIGRRRGPAAEAARLYGDLSRPRPPEDPDPAPAGRGGAARPS